MKLTKRNRKYLRKISPVQILTSTQSLPSQPISVRPPPPPVTPPQTPRPVPAQPLAPATAPPVPRPQLPDNTPTVPPLVIRRSPGLYTKSHHSRHLSTTPGCPGPLSPLPPPTPAGPAHYVIPAPSPWSPAISSFITEESWLLFKPCGIHTSQWLSVTCPTLCGGQSPSRVRRGWKCCDQHDNYKWQWRASPQYVGWWTSFITRFGNSDEKEKDLLQVVQHYRRENPDLLKASLAKI